MNPEAAAALAALAETKTALLSGIELPAGDAAARLGLSAADAPAAEALAADAAGVPERARGARSTGRP